MVAPLGLWLALISIAGAPASAQDRSQILWPTKEWATSTAEEQGMDSQGLADLVAYGAGHDFDSVLVVRHGRMVLDAYYAPYKVDIPHQLHSVTKSVTGTLMGMIYKDGLLDSLDHQMLDFFADRQIANVDDKKKAITVQNLLDMTSGFSWIGGHEGGREQSDFDKERSGDWIQFILDRPMAYTPGWFFYYNNGNPELLAAIITKLTGKPAEDYAKERLFDPLGIVTWHWERDPQGFAMGQGGLHLLPRDMAKIGYLYLHHGEWDGTQLLPPGWADVLSHRTVNMNDSHEPDLRYSNLFWVFPGKHYFMATGKNGQLIIVIPDLDIVAVVTARRYSSFERVPDYISRAVVSNTALPANPAAARLLATAIGDVATERPSEVGRAPDIASAISGKTYKFQPDNALDIKSLTLFLADANPHLVAEYYGDDRQVSALIGLDGLYRKGPLTHRGFTRLLKGAWQDRQTFAIDLQELGGGEESKIFLSFNGHKLNLRTKDGSGDNVSIDAAQVE